MSVATETVKKQNDAWAREYLLDPLNPVEAWQTAQVGGQYNNRIPSQHMQKKTFDLGRSKSQRRPSSQPSNYTLGRSKSQHIPNASAGPSISRENERPNHSPQRTPRMGPPPPPRNPQLHPQQRHPMIRRHSSGEDIEFGSKHGHQHGYNSGHLHKSHMNPRHHIPRSHRVQADLIDNLDTSMFGIPYHHEGPFDATLAARNRKPWSSPVEATKHGNAMALQATSKYDIENSLMMGRPLDGVAAFPPGSIAPGGEVMPDYEEYDLHRKDGNFRRWKLMDYRDEDLKGKGVVGYDGDLRERQAKADRKAHKRGKSLQPPQDTFELEDRNRSGRPKSSDADNGPGISTGVKPSISTGLKRGGSTAGRLETVEKLGQKIKRRFSLRKPKPSGNAST